MIRFVLDFLLSKIPLVLDLSSGELRYDTRNEYYLCYKHVVELNREIEKLKKEKRELNDWILFVFYSRGFIWCDNYGNGSCKSWRLGFVLNRKESMELFEAEEELKSVNSQLTLFMKKKKALQDFIQEENERLERLDNPITKIWKLKKDKEFLATYGRERTAREIGILVGYSERQVQRYLAKKKD